MGEKDMERRRIVRRGIVATLVGGTFWGLNGTVSKWLMDTYAIDPLWLVCLRELAACWLFLAAAAVTSIKIWVQKRGLWNLIKEDSSSARFFSFMNVCFSKLSFSPDTTAKTIPTKIKVKKVDKARFRFENDVLNEPFGLFDLAWEYVENGYYKG